MEMIKGFTSPSSCNALLAAIVALLVFSSTMKSCSATTTNSSNTNFIRSCCASTQYPKLCYSSLSPYARYVGTNHTKLAIVALKVSLRATWNTSALLTKMSRGHHLMANESSAIKDCIDEVKDAVHELKQSLAEMNYLYGPDFEFNISSIEAWVSAALTDDTTCMDGLYGLNGKVETTIRKSVTAAENLTSNALAIIDSLTSYYKSKGTVKTP